MCMAMGNRGGNRLILVDPGVAFPDMDTSPGVDLIFADITWLKERVDQLEAVFVTHAHEDHVGAVAHCVNRHSTVTHYQRPNMTHLQEGGTGEEVSEILFFSAKSKRRPSLIYSMQIIPVCLSIVARRKGVSATRRGGSNWTPISILVGHPCKLFHTHCHEALGVPVYARAFTANIARRRMEEHGHPTEAVHTASPWPEQIRAGPFTVSFLPVSHSIPESAGLVIDTPSGRIVHSGDFKLDANPVVGQPFDPDLWAEVAKSGVMALVCDSTNVFSSHPGRLESEVGPEITRLVRDANGMVIATTFASNVARVKTLAEAARKAGRSVVLLGRAMRRMIEAATETGILTDFPKVISAEEALALPRQNLMLIVTGSQGERRAASAQLARGKYRGLEVKEGDLFLFSSKTIPGNERGVIRIMNQLSEKGVDVVDDSSGLYHVSGHANRPDLEKVHSLINPQMVIPMHGEHRHLREHAKLAEAGGRIGILAMNGTLLDLTGNAPKVADYIETGRTYLDGSARIGALDGVVRDRIRMALNGHVTITVILDEDGELLGEP